jgi:signal transduction histidine kinase
MNLVLDRKAMQVGGDAVTRKEDTAQGRLLRGYLHKTSNSLCGIKGYASLIAEDLEGAEGAASWARKIIAEVERMEAIFRSVGDLAGTRRIPDLEVSLQAVLNEVIRICRRNYSGLEFICRDLEEGEILLPAADLALVLQELVKNSVEAVADEKLATVIEVSCCRSETGRIALTFQDHGEGIAPEVLPQVVEPFLTTKPGHLGMGLTRVETLMEMYELPWNLFSRPGQGTSVTLEVAAPEEQARSIVRKGRKVQT